MLFNFFVLSLASAVAAPASTDQPIGAHHSQEHLRPRSAPDYPVTPPLRSKGEHIATVYGYVYGGSSSSSYVDFDSVTHVAWHAFNMDSSGNISDSAGWSSYGGTFVNNAHAVGTNVHISLMPTSTSNMSTVLASASRRATAVSQLAAYVNMHNADGVSLDFESLPSSVKAEYVLFTQEVAAVVDEVVVAVPLVDWNGAYDFDELAWASNGLFIMGYDAHGQSSSPGPTSPLNDGGIWPFWSLTWSLNDYRTWGAPDDKIIMGLPLFGNSWYVSSDEVAINEPSTATAQKWSTCRDFFLFEYTNRYEPYSETPWVWTGERQAWCDDIDSIELKIQWALDEGLQGIGFWELSYASGDQDLWSMVDDLTMEFSTDPVDTGGTSTTGDSGYSGDSGDSGDSSVIDTGSTQNLDTALGNESKGGCGCASKNGEGLGLFWLSGLLGLVLRRRNC